MHRAQESEKNIKINAPKQLVKPNRKKEAERSNE